MDSIDLKSLVTIVEKYVDALRNTDLCPEETQVFLHDALVNVHGYTKEAANEAIDAWENAGWKPERWDAEQVEKLWDEDSCMLETITEAGIFEYELTPDEIEYFEWIRGRYLVADILADTIVEHDDGTVTVTVDTLEVGLALVEEGLDRLPCCSEDCMINRLVWFIGPDENNQ
tara:strand:- start:844 stop:1362 length:519 start_codon:yes stop_codon:yes gene_type:complete